MFSRLVLTLPLLSVLSSGLLAQEGQPAQAAFPAGSTIIINTAPPPEPAIEKCAPLNKRMDGERCDSLLLPTQVIRLKPGTGRKLRFDRMFKRIEIESDPPDSIDIEWVDSATTALVKAKRSGTAELLVFADTGPGPNGKRDVMFSATIIASDAPAPAVVVPPPLDNSTRIQVFNQKTLSQATNWDCTEVGCTRRTGN